MSQIIPEKVGFFRQLVTRTTGTGLDIGGTLAKIVYYEPYLSTTETDIEIIDQTKKTEFEHMQRLHKFINSSTTYGITGFRDKKFEYHSTELGGTLYFIKFQTGMMSDFLQLVKENKLVSRAAQICATGGGALKFETDFLEQLHIELRKQDELECLLRGINFSLQTFKNECFYLKDPMTESMQKIYIELDIQSSSIYPFIVCNIGSGVSILKVTSENTFARIGGSSIGGSTFLGLARTFTGCETFNEALELASQGDHSQVDMLVKDIYGKSYDLFNLPGDIVASSFGKLVRKSSTEAFETIEKQHFAKSALLTVTNNIGSIAHLHARLEGVDKVFFVGSFFANNIFSMKNLAYATDFWSKGSIKAVFLEHEGYFGALGALIQSFAIV
eukprot:TRINITY_DN8937_c0_g1_i2.p1 TRINITY_DN8937_c0_g1~~TRINITY_DN8937_c0_g1_i2.p1  ORF type:complete len:387 (+),score=174.72 TRINITY_DN8937_c0_g1_i2:64-1224(+)